MGQSPKSSPSAPFPSPQGLTQGGGDLAPPWNWAAAASRSVATWLPAISRALVLRIRLQKSFVERHRMTQLVKLNAHLGTAQKTQQHTATHFCFWKEPTMLLRHPHPFPNSKAVARLPCIDCPQTHGNSGVVALIFGNGHDHCRSAGVPRSVSRISWTGNVNSAYSVPARCYSTGTVQFSACRADSRHCLLEQAGHMKPHEI